MIIPFRAGIKTTPCSVTSVQASLQVLAQNTGSIDFLVVDVIIYLSQWALWCVYEQAKIYKQLEAY